MRHHRVFLALSPLLPPLILLFLLWLPRTLGNSCHVTTQLSARRAVTEDSIVSTTVYAGHQGKMLHLMAVWQQPQNSTVVLDSKHSLLANDVPSDWYDGQSPLTLERLVFSSRQATRFWHVSSIKELPVPDPSTTGLLYLGQTSPLWYSHAAVIFTGTQLRFVEQQPGAPCTAMQALEQASTRGDDSRRHVLLYLNSPLKHRLAVVNRAGEPVAEWNDVTLHWGVDMAQTLIPVDAAGLLAGDSNLHLELGHRVHVLSGRDMQEGFLAAPHMPDFSATVAHISSPGRQLVLGRRLLAKISTAWAVDASGHVAVQLVTMAESIDTSDSPDGVDSIPDAVLWTACVCGLLLVGLATYWTSHLGGSLRLMYQPPPPMVAGDKDAQVEGSVVTRRDIIIGYAVLVLSVIAHALMGVYGGHDVLADSSLEAPLASFVLSQWIGTCAAGFMLLALLVLETLRESDTWYYGSVSSSCRRRYVSIQLYAIALGTMAVRGVLASLLVAAGTTVIQLGVTALIALTFVFFPCFYSTSFLFVHLFTGQRLYLPKHRDSHGIERMLLIFMFLVMLGLSVVFIVAIPLWLIQPFLDVCNGFYSTQTVQSTAILAMCTPILAVSFSLNESGKNLLRQASAASLPRLKTV